MCREQLLAPREAVVGQEVAAAVAQRVIDEAPEMSGGALDVRRAVIDVQVEDDAGPGFARPGQRGLVFRFDEPDGAVDEVDAVEAEVAAHVVHEREQPVARHVELGDHLAATHRGAEAVIQRAVIVLEVQVQLVRVAPVELAVGGEIEVGELPERRLLVEVREREQLVPVALRQASLIVADRPVVLHGTVARQHAGAQEIGALRRGGELEIAVQVAGGDALIEGVDELLDLEPRDAALAP